MLYEVITFLIEIRIPIRFMYKNIIIITPISLPKVVATATPITPSFGIPKNPYISIAFPNTLTTFIIIEVNIHSLTKPLLFKNEEKVTRIACKNSPLPIIDKYVTQ